MNKLDLSNTDDRTFPKIMRQQAEQNGNTDFLVTDKLRITFSQADELTNVLAGGLKSLGVTKGDRVALFMGNVPEMVLLTLAINKLGAIWTPINTDYKGDWLLNNLQHSCCKVLVTDENLQQRIADIQDRLDIEQFILLSDTESTVLKKTRLYKELLNHEPVPLDFSEHHYGDTCAILWTSGTTGNSKGVLQSYNSWIRPIIRGASLQYDSQEGDVIYCALPLFNSAAWCTSIYRALIEGIPCVIEPKFSVNRFKERVQHFGATQTFIIGAMGVFLLNSPEQPDDKDLSLRVAGITPMSPHLRAQFEQRFNVKILRGGLGMSECQLVATQTEARDDVPVYALGFPADDSELRLVDENRNEVAPGEQGELCIRELEPYVLFNGYFNDPEANADAYCDEWFLTGDIARQDIETGAYFYVDRKKDVVRFAGRNISTLEVETVVNKHPAVSDVAAFGIPSTEISSEHELKLNVVLRENMAVSGEALSEFINNSGPHYFVPRYINFVDSLPYTPTNKVQKYKLRDEGINAETWDLRRSNYQVLR